ncbi:kinase-like protein, partial [Clavulina sp. PMI_390]
PSQLVYREAITHAQLSHHNIIPFLGVYQDNSTKYPFTVLPYVRRGSLQDFISKLPPGETLRLHDLTKILVGSSNGIVYLHSRTPPIIHGDLHLGNILINENGEPLLCDFGRSRIRHLVSRLSARQEGGQVRFLAPELSDGKADRFSPTQESDIFALSMIFLNAWSGQAPFFTIRNEFQVQARIVRGERPALPNVTDTLSPEVAAALWGLLEDMWAHEASMRPRIGQVLKRLE